MSGEKDNKVLFGEFQVSKYHLSQRTKDFYIYEVGHFLKLVSKPVRLISCQDIEAHIAGLTSRNANGKDCRYRALWVFWSWLHERGYVPSNPFSNKLVARPKRPQRLVTPYTKEQLDILLASAPTIRDKALVSLLADSGARVSEILAIRQGDINLQEREIRVIGKGNKERFIPFGPATESILLIHLQTYKLGETNIWGLKTRFGISEILERLEKRTGIHCNPHSFRYSFAIILREKGVSPLAIMDLGGWDDMDMVMHYTRGYDKRQSRKFYEPVVT